MATALLWYVVVTGALAAVLVLVISVQAVLPHLHRSTRALPDPFPVEPERQQAYGHAAA